MLERIEIMPLLPLAKQKMMYDADSGEFRWRKGFRGCPAGKLVGFAREGEHREIGIGGKLVYAHRLAWAWVHNEEPPEEIDHEDRNKHNNAISNLRDGSGNVNDYNRGIQANNSTGVSGVTQQDRSWLARAGGNKNRKTLYHGKDFFEAVCARKSWENEYWKAA